MKIIFDTTLKNDNVSSVTASTSDTNYPASNLRDDFTTNLWQAVSGANLASVSAGVTAGSAVELLNTNATSATITIGTGGTFILEQASTYGWDDDVNLEAQSAISSSVVNLSGSNGRIWAEFANQTTPFIIRFDLVAPAGTTLNAGILRAGNVLQINDPAPGHQESSKDYSIELELNSGANYFRKRNVVRTFTNLSIIATRASVFNMKMNVFDALGPKPVAIKMFDSMTDTQFIIFAKRVNPPQIAHLTPIYSAVQLELTEVV